jgi:uncharacterized protein YndB with AHSA1/START domain
MSRTVTMAVDLPCSPARLYRMYLDPKVHAAFTGAPELTHVKVADSDFAGVSEGWSKYYWLPWREYLDRRSKSG